MNNNPFDTKSFSTKSFSASFDNTQGGTQGGIPLNLGGLGDGVKRLLWIFLILWVLGTLGLGGLVKSLFLVVALIALVPIVGLFALQWWLKRNLAAGACPVCNQAVQGINGSVLQCASCGETLDVNQGMFTRQAQAGTIDVQAVEVMAQIVEE
jgi:hypothetical protein